MNELVPGPVTAGSVQEDSGKTVWQDQALPSDGLDQNATYVSQVVGFAAKSDGKDKNILRNP